MSPQAPGSAAALLPVTTVSPSPETILKEAEKEGMRVPVSVKGPEYGPVAVPLTVKLDAEQLDELPEGLLPVRVSLVKVDGGGAGAATAGSTAPNIEAIARLRLRTSRRLCCNLMRSSFRHAPRSRRCASAHTVLVSGWFMCCARAGTDTRLDHDAWPPRMRWMEHRRRPAHRIGPLAVRAPWVLADVARLHRAGVIPLLLGHETETTIRPEPLPRCSHGLGLARQARAEAPTVPARCSGQPELRHQAPTDHVSRGASSCHPWWLMLPERVRLGSRAPHASFQRRRLCRCTARRNLNSRWAAFVDGPPPSTERRRTTGE